MSPADPPFEIRYTGTQQEALSFLQRLAEEQGFQNDYLSDPLRVLRDNGWVLEPEEAFPQDPVYLAPDQLQAAIKAVEEEERWWPWIWWLIPWIGRSGPEGGESETA